MESKFFAEAISRRRLDAGLTQEALAQKAGINRTTYGSIERGQRTLSNANLVRLAIALGARIEDVLAEAYRVQYVALLEIEPAIRQEMGVAPRAGEDRDETEPYALVDSLVAALKALLVRHVQTSRREPTADFLAPLPGFPGKPRKRARPAGRRIPR